MTHNKQLKILRERGLIVPTGNPKRVLEKVNYYNLINGYKDLFIDSDVPSSIGERYKQGARFSEIHALYNFDNELKAIILKRLLRIEKTIKSEIAYVFSERYGHDNYLKIENFDNYNNNSKQEIIKLISSIQSDIARGLNYRSIGHYITQHGYVPLWVLTGILTFGRISTFYKLMKQPDRQKVSKIYEIQDNELISLLKVLTLCRNKCAHDEILYNFKVKQAISNSKIHTDLNIPTTSGGNPKQGKQDLFAVIIAIKILINKKEFNKMINEIKHALELLEKELHVISKEDILDKLGFPNNWEDVKKAALKPKKTKKKETIPNAIK